MDYQDYLSEDLEEETIGNMSIGDKGYTVPWAVEVDKDRKLWINGEMLVNHTSGGTIHLKVKRIDDDKFIINRKSIKDFKYSPQIITHLENYYPVSITSEEF
jgi:hypothetical protein